MKINGASGEVYTVLSRENSQYKKYYCLSTAREPFYHERFVYKEQNIHITNNLLYNLFHKVAVQSFSQSPSEDVMDNGVNCSNSGLTWETYQSIISCQSMSRRYMGNTQL